MTDHRAERFRVDSLKDARAWVWKQLLRRAGTVSSEALRNRWSWDPMLLEDALTSLRDGGMVACTKGVWWIRTWQQTPPE